jgi:hypothetical protein
VAALRKFGLFTEWLYIRILADVCLAPTLTGWVPAAINATGVASAAAALSNFLCYPAYIGMPIKLI